MMFSSWKTMRGEQSLALRAETTEGSYRMAQHILRTTKTKPPLGVWQLGQSFRRETSDGANAANLRFNAFYQLEFQLIYSKPYTDDNGKPRGTQAPIPQLLKDALVPLVAKLTGLESRLVPSDRLPVYSEATDDIEVFWHAPTKEAPEWKEVCSMSQRTDFTATIEGIKDPLTVFEVAFGADRMVAVSQGYP
jgi:glycyl-tRNA synthetase